MEAIKVNTLKKIKKNRIILKEMAEVEAIKMNRDILKSILSKKIKKRKAFSKEWPRWRLFKVKKDILKSTLKKKYSQKKEKYAGKLQDRCHIHTYMELGYIHIFSDEREREKGGGGVGF